MHRPLRIVVALVAAVAVSLTPGLAFGAGGAPPSDDPATSAGAALVVGAAPVAPPADVAPAPGSPAPTPVPGGEEPASDAPPAGVPPVTDAAAPGAVDAVPDTVLPVPLPPDPDPGPEREHPHRVEVLHLACEGVDTDRRTGVACKWSPSEHPRFAGYQLVRSDGEERTVVFASRERRATTHFDEEVRRGVRYRYAVLAVDDAGAIIGRSRPAEAGLRELKYEELRFDCEAVRHADRPAVACKWAETQRPDARGYVLYRSVDGGAREELARTGLDGRRHHLDRDVAPGHRYTYAVIVVDRSGEPIGRGGPVTVGIPPKDRPAPSPTPVDARPDRGDGGR